MRSGSWRPLGPARAVGLVLEDRVEHLEPGADHEGQQALFELAGELGDGHGDRVGQRDGRLVRHARVGLAFFGVVRPVPARRVEV